MKQNLLVNKVFGLDFVKDMPGQLVGLLSINAETAVPLPYTEV